MPALRPVTLQAGPVPGGAVQRLLQGISPAAKLRRRLRRTRAASGGRAVSSKRGGTGLAVERFKSRPPSGLLQNSRILGPRVHPNIFTRGSGVACGDRWLCWSATDPDPQTERIPPAWLRSPRSRVSLRMTRLTEPAPPRGCPARAQQDGAARASAPSRCGCACSHAVLRCRPVVTSPSGSAEQARAPDSSGEPRQCARLRAAPRGGAHAHALCQRPVGSQAVFVERKKGHDGQARPAPSAPVPSGPRC